MPLVKSGTREAVSENIRRERGAGKPQKQAVAIALDVARRNGAHFAHGGSIYAPADAPHITPSERRSFDELLSIAQPPAGTSSGKPFMPGYAAGGAPAAPPWFIRNEARTMGHQGFIGSIVPGRTDRHQMSVAGGSYVWPSDVVSAIGQGNSLAGANKLSQFFKMGPYGSTASQMPHNVKSIRQKFSDGGETPSTADIVTAGGEFITPPDRMAEVLGKGDLDHAHNVADVIVKHIRRSTIGTLRKLPGPKGAKK